MVPPIVPMVPLPELMVQLTVLMIPPTIFMDPLTLLKFQPLNVQDSTTNMFMVLSTLTFFKVPYELFKIPPPRDHVCDTHQMVHGP